MPQDRRTIEVESNTDVYSRVRGISQTRLHRSGRTSVSRAHPCRASADSSLSRRPRDTVDVISEAARISLRVSDALCHRRKRTADLSDKQHGDAHPEPSGRSARQSVCLNDKSRRSTGVLQRLNSAVRLIQRTTQGGSSRHYVLPELCTGLRLGGGGRGCGGLDRKSTRL